jgi:hypothetical protein
VPLVRVPLLPPVVLVLLPVLRVLLAMFALSLLLLRTRMIPIPSEHPDPTARVSRNPGWVATPGTATLFERSESMASLRDSGVGGSALFW